MFNQKPMLGQLPDWTRFPQPAALYVMNEGTGSIINDLSGNGNTATPQRAGGVVWRAGELDPVIEFGNPWQYLLTLNNGNRMNLSEGTAVFWLKDNNSTAYACFFKLIYDTDNFIVIYSDGTNWDSPAEVAGTNKGLGNFAVIDSSYHQFGLTWSQAGNFREVFFDGVLVTSTTWGTPAGIPALCIGGDSGDAPDVFFDNAIIFDQAISHQQIQQLSIDPFPWFHREPAIKLWTPPEDGGIVVLRRRRECA